ncbi:MULTISPECIES: hypothetical protein [Methylomonas]|uniref:Lipoprotein n=2 Tax=Methylomonas TaxID=416 RepID=A0A126T904_9GAMM|nr:MULTISPECIES: hypothetical protein [Methylomonas]AMK78540.1 hypothetical protein JT25_018935 [Methylomonas denitrificans]OAI09089.1 hypothetical protein A1342_13280 [Methylomonas methanica]TCV82308.1 hypothetical protein EDE11_11471 [Methylomonas methanica]
MRMAIKPTWLKHAISLFGGISLLAGCANINTLSRTTPLDFSKNEGKAVHLDIQQRLFIVNQVGKYCAEPSPDALAAFAAALGIGASVPPYGTGSLATSGSSSAASIGLRTQSITLMRDALYRMCEAYGNGELSGPQVMALLSRSQDLTAVILATEQLTGAVVAQQAGLSSSASADATSLMTATSQLLEVALKQQQEAQKSLEQGIERKSDSEGKQKLAQAELASAQSNRENNSGDDAAGQSAAARLLRAERELATADREIALAEEIRALRQKTLDATTERVESLKATLDSGATTAAASSSGSAAFSGSGSYNRLNDQSTVAIAGAVSSMVNNVLNKPYVLDYCMAMVSSNDNSKAAQYFSLCQDVILKAIKIDEVRVTGTSDEFEGGDLKTTSCIESWLNSDAANMAKLTKWRKLTAGGIDHVIFMFGKSAKSLRAAAVNDLSISCNLGG